MPQYVRDLTGVIAYFAAIAAVLGGMAWGVATAADALASSPAGQAVSALLEEDDAERSKISRMVQSSREIRAALAKPLPPPPALQPITASVEHGKLLTAERQAPRHKPKRKTVPRMPREALDAMAQGPWAMSPQPNPQIDLHKVY